jgi:hypothetical protein
MMLLVEYTHTRGTVWQNLAAVGWNLTREQVTRLDTASAVVPPYPYYPYWNGQFTERNPPPV